MLTLIQFLIFGHTHKWKIIKEAQDDYNMTVYYCQCERCGRPKRFGNAGWH